MKDAFPVTANTAPLISSQRFLDRATVMHKARTFKVFVVRTLYIELRGVMYWVLIDGHHNLAAARMLGIELKWSGPSSKTKRVMREMGQEAFAQFLVNNLTDSDWYDVDTGKVVDALR